MPKEDSALHHEGMKHLTRNHHANSVRQEEVILQSVSIAEGIIKETKVCTTGIPHRT